MGRTQYVVLFCALCVFAGGLMPTLADAQRRRGGFDSETRTKINALGDTVVAQVPIPVFGVAVSELTRNFGDPRDGGAREHEGLDILAPEGTPVASPTAAVVTSVGSGSSSGIYVRTANPGGETFAYMHLSSVADGIERGAVLERGDIIGFIGDTGNAEGGPPHLHFEMRRGGATDPFPRLTTAFTLAEEMQSITKLIGRGNSEAPAFLVEHFTDELIEARVQGIPLPQSILAILPTAPVAAQPSVTVTPSGTAPSATASQPVVHMTLGATGSAVGNLQKFLIARNAGPSANALEAAGATGYFGTLTQAALREYQARANIPVTGVVDETTFALVLLLATESAVPTDTLETLEFSRDLTIGSTGEDVRSLQMFLNEEGFMVATAGVGSPGNETEYFGTLTQQALAKYQSAHLINPPAGYFGPITRAFVATQGEIASSAP